MRTLDPDSEPNGTALRSGPRKVHVDKADGQEFWHMLLVTIQPAGAAGTHLTVMRQHECGFCRPWSDAGRRGGVVRGGVRLLSDMWQISGRASTNS